MLLNSLKFYQLGIQDIEKTLNNQTQFIQNKDKILHKGLCQGFNNCKKLKSFIKIIS